MRAVHLTSAIFDRILHLPPALTRDVLTQKNLSVPMANGVDLKADRYWAAGRSGDPLVLMRTPYGRGGVWSMVARSMAQRGVQVLIVSCRGTFGSGGDWMPMRDEAPDGLATYRWVEQQPWFGGSVILAGPSYLGYTQWALAGQIPDSITAMVPHVTSSRLTLPFIRPDALDWDLLVRWNFLLERQESAAATVRSLLRLDEKRLQQAMLTMPKQRVDLELAGHRWQFLQDCLRHDSADPHWRSTDHSAAVQSVSTPTSYVGGWYDIFLADQLRDFAATAAAGADHRLTIGPWTHSSPAGLGTAIAENLYFGVPYARGGRPGQRAPIRLYVMGTGHQGSAVPGIAVDPPRPWRDFQSWPPAGYPATSLHLTADGGLSSIAASEITPTGRRSDSKPSMFRYDPEDPTPSCGGPLLSIGAGPMDNRALEKRSDVLIFSTAVLREDVEVIGEVSAEIHFASSLGFADVFVRLCDVDAKGHSRNISDGIVGFEFTPDRPTAVRISMWPTAYLFRRGHRIRVQVSSGSHPRYARNPGTGEPRATATTALAADQQVWHDAGHQSVITLPLRESHRAHLQ